jgi:signal transduction histidine kinase
MGALMRQNDWSQTPLGPVASWPQSLRTSVSIMLSSGFAVVVAWGPEFIFLYNDRYRPVLGASKHPMALGSRSQDIFPEVWDFIGPLFRRTRAGETVALDDVLIPLDRNGYLEECFFTLSYSPIRDESGGVGGMLAIVAETTERVQSERRLRTLRDLAAIAPRAHTADEACVNATHTLAQNAADVPFALAFLVDGDRIRLASGAGLPDGIGVDPRDWPLGEASRRGHALTVRNLGERIGDLSGGMYPEPTHTAVVLPLARPGVDQPYGYLVVGVSPRRALDDNYKGFFDLVVEHIVTGITNALAHEAERKRAQSLAELDRAKTTFFSNVSHEFRTPLTLMLGPTEDLLAGVHGELPPAQRAQLELLRRNELRLHRLVNALLEFSRLEAGRIQAWFEPVDVAELTRQVASAFQSAIERAGIEFRVDCPPVGDPIYLDPDMWEQIVLNLLSNAFKFTFDGAIAVVLCGLAMEVQLEVSDSGVGVRSEDVPRLFERFHRIEGTRARTHEGSGIGLALVQELVRLHGGTISARSTFGKGTTFTVRIPKGSAHLPRDRVGPRPSRELLPERAAAFVEEALRWLPRDGQPIPIAAEGAVSAQGHRRPALATGDAEARVLVADDNADMRDYLQRILGESWSVEAVADGHAALEAARRQLPDIIVTDIMMPVLDGFGLLRQVRADERLKAIPVVMLSARAGEESRAIGIEAGADDYLVKPFSARELIARVRTHLELARARVALDGQWQEWMAILRQAPFAISLVRMPERRYEFVNEVHIRTTGRDITGLTLDEAFGGSSPAERESLRRSQDEIFAGEGTVFLPDFPWRAPDGTTRHFSAAARPWFASDGTKSGIIGISVDITDQVLDRQRAQEINEQAKRSEGALRRALALREEFLTIASHELRTPLTTLGLQAEALLRSIQESPPGNPPIDRWARKAERLHSQVARLAQLIEGTFGVAGLEGAGVRLQLEDCDLARVVAGVVERFRGESKQAQRRIEFRAEPAPGRWDPKRLDQLTSQLVSNALEFGGDEPVEISVGLVDDGARISVRDHGIGVARVDRDRIFERFEGAVSSEHFAGLGVGLWIASELAKAMGGTARVESSPGAGATFIVHLPRNA